MVITGLTRKRLGFVTRYSVKAPVFSQKLRFPAVFATLACRKQTGHLSIFYQSSQKNNIRRGIEEVITGLTRNQFVGQPARGFESHPLRIPEPLNFLHSWVPFLRFALILPLLERITHVKNGKVHIPDCTCAFPLLLLLYYSVRFIVSGPVILLAQITSGLPVHHVCVKLKCQSNKFMIAISPYQYCRYSSSRYS